MLGVLLPCRDVVDCVYSILAGLDHCNMTDELECRREPQEISRPHKSDITKDIFFYDSLVQTYIRRT